jgi:MFS family permease
MNNNLKASVLSALVLAFASFGDAFLYTALPINYEYLHIPVVWIGLLLSINRFVRLAANQLFAYWFTKFGVRQIILLAAIGAVLTTALYGLATNIAIWILARIIWGFCFSALRIGSICYSVQGSRQGFNLGLSKGLQELGPAIGLLIGPLLLRWTNPSAAFLILSLASLSAVLIASMLPELKQISLNYRFTPKIIPTSFNLLTFLSFFFVQGVLVVLIGRLLEDNTLNVLDMTLLAGMFLAYRRVCVVVISPLGGLAADKFGVEKVYLAGYLLTIFGFVLIVLDASGAGILIVFTFNSVTAALGPKNAMKGATNFLKDVAINSTWADIGAAFGTLAGGFILFAHSPVAAIIIATFVLTVAYAYHIETTKFQTKELLKWK